MDDSIDLPKQVSENQQSNDEHSDNEVLGDDMQEDEADPDSSYNENQ